MVYSTGTLLPSKLGILKHKKFSKVNNVSTDKLVTIWTQLSLIFYFNYVRFSLPKK